MRKSIFLLSALLLPFIAESASDRTVDAGVIEFKQTTPAPATPSAGYNKCWVKPADGKLYCLNSAGVEARVQDSKMEDLILEDAVSGDTITIQAATPSAGSYTLKLPPADGSNGQVIKTDGAGNLGFADAGGAGGAGINLVTLDTAANNWEISKAPNFDLEASVGDWLAYADAAGTSPVDMTGGSPSTTCARDTSTEINGSASLKMDLGSGSSRQGEGCSLLVNVPSAYRGKNVAFVFPFTTSGTLLQDDLKLVAYDVTNGAILDVFTKGRILGSSGQALGVIGIPSSAAQIRVGIHVARTSTAALSMVGDDFQVSPQIPSAGLNGSSSRSYTPVYGSGLGSATGSLNYWLVGDRLIGKGKITAGTVAGSYATFSLPSGLRLDSSKLAANNLNSAAGPEIGTFSTNGANIAGALITATASDETVIYFGNTRNVSNALVPTFGSTVFGNGAVIDVEFSVPIAGQSSNVSSSESSTYFISNYLANGTRVTGSAPTKLGEYRSYLRDAGSTTFTETNASPADAPSVANGIRIYDGNGYSSADTNNNPTRYEIFVGKNKNVRVFFYADPGRTGFIDTSPSVPSNQDIGYIQSYDPVTGVLAIAARRYNGSAVDHRSGVNGTGTGFLDDPYFDIQVSENALAVQADYPGSIGEQVSRVQQINGQGSTNTAVLRFTNVLESTGTEFTYADSSTLGGSWTINTAGFWDLTCSLSINGSTTVAITLNASQLTTDPPSMTIGQIIGTAQAAADTLRTVSAKRYFPAGSILRVHANTGIGSGSSNGLSMCTLVKTGVK